MFHVVTVHYRDERWIAPQLRHLERNLDDFRIYATLNDIKGVGSISGEHADAARAARFAYTDEFEGTHADKLNHLAGVVVASAPADDLLVFLDGDAFPIAPITAALLGGTPLAAVRRDENLGQRQPHPSFCLTTVGFWSEIAGDWRAGATWTAANGEETTDTGGNLLAILEARGVTWRPLLRTNRVNLDPLWFAVYADAIYHHGAGFRAPTTFRVTSPSQARVRASTRAARTPSWVPLLARVERSLRYRLARGREQRALDAYLADAQRRSDEVFGWIERDPEFYRRFLDPAPADQSGGDSGNDDESATRRR